MTSKTAIIGVGNKLMGDEGVGVHAVEYLRKNPPSPPFPSHIRRTGAKGGKVDGHPPFRHTSGGQVKKGGRGGFDNVDILDAGTGGMALFHLLEKYERVIIIDAADFGGRPGEVRTSGIAPVRQSGSGGSKAKQSPDRNCVHGIASSPLDKLGTPRNDMQLALDPPQVSLHGTSLAGILQLAEKLGTKMPEITIVAVQPEYIGYKLELSPAVKKTFDKIAKIVEVLARSPKGDAAIP